MGTAMTMIAMIVPFCYSLTLLTKSPSLCPGPVVDANAWLILQSASLALRRRILGADVQGALGQRRLTHELSDLASASSTRLETAPGLNSDQDPTSVVALLSVAGMPVQHCIVTHMQAI